MWPIAQTLRDNIRNRGDAAKGGSHHVAIFERRRQAITLIGIMPKPVQQLGKSPLRRIGAATPVDRLQSKGVRPLGDLLGLAPGAMIAPERIVVKRLESDHRQG